MRELGVNLGVDGFRTPFQIPEEPPVMARARHGAGSTPKLAWWVTPIFQFNSIERSDALQDRIDRPRVATPVVRLVAQPLPSGRRQRVVARAAVVVRRAPLGVH